MDRKKVFLVIWSHDVIKTEIQLSIRGAFLDREGAMARLRECMKERDELDEYVAGPYIIEQEIG
jgi:hypothetical protein